MTAYLPSSVSFTNRDRSLYALKTNQPPPTPNQLLLYTAKHRQTFYERAGGGDTGVHLDLRQRGGFENGGPEHGGKRAGAARDVRLIFTPVP